MIHNLLKGQKSLERKEPIVVNFLEGKLINMVGWILALLFLPSDIIAAVLFAQLENLDDIQQKRKLIWNQYFNLLKPLHDQGFLKLPQLPEYSSNNAHMFYLVWQYRR